MLQISNNGDLNNDGIKWFFPYGMYIINNGQVVESDSISSQKFGSIFSIDIINMDIMIF